ncbi:unnamed protein product, partial [Allacma fusca]
ILIDTYLGL